MSSPSCPVDISRPQRRKGSGSEWDVAASLTASSLASKRTQSPGSSCASQSTAASSRESSPVPEHKTDRMDRMDGRDELDKLDKLDKDTEVAAGGAGRIRTDGPRPRYPLLRQILSPRPYEQIAAEMDYLSGSLQAETHNTARLLGHYSLVQEALLGEAAVGKHRRRLRKQLSSLKCRISQASLQEKTILVRLGELHMELQSMHTWSQLQLRRIIRPVAAVAAPARPLNAACSEFVPAPRHPDPDPAPAPAPTPSQTRALEYSYEKRAKQTSWEDHDEQPSTTAQHDRRPSLPSIHFIWPDDDTNAS